MKTPSSVSTYDLWEQVPRRDADLAEHSTWLYSSAAWSRLEEVAHPTGQFHVALTDAVGTAVASCYRFTAQSNPWRAARIDLFLKDHLGADERAALLPSVSIGGRRPGHSHILTAGVHNSAERFRLLRDIIEVAADRARSEDAQTLAALYVPHEDIVLRGTLQDLGAHEFPADSNHVIPVPVGGWDSWFQSLDKKRRANVKAEVRQLERANVRYDVTPLREDLVPEIVGLELGQYRKYGVDYSPGEARGLHEAYLRFLPDKTSVVRAFVGDQLAGFVSLVPHGATLYARQCSFDDGACGDAPVYMGAIYHTGLHWAASQGFHELDLSISADDTKRRKGATPQRRSAFVLPLTAKASAALRTARDGTGPTIPDWTLGLLPSRPQRLSRSTTTPTT